jgi:hypothetical protein
MALRYKDINANKTELLPTQAVTLSSREVHNAVTELWTGVNVKFTESVVPELGCIELLRHCMRLGTKNPNMSIGAK